MTVQPTTHTSWTGVASHPGEATLCALCAQGRAYEAKTVTNYALLHSDDEGSRVELARRVRSFGNDPWWV